MPRKRKDQSEMLKKRADLLTRQRRTDEFVRIRLRGAKFWDLKEYVREKEKELGSAWHLLDGQAPMCDAQIGIYQRQADDVIIASVEQDREKVIARSLARREELYACALAAGEIRTALSCEQDLGALLGLYPDGQKPATQKRPLFAGAVVEDDDDTAIE